jgi:hypothetical protein
MLATRRTFRGAHRPRNPAPDGPPPIAACQQRRDRLAIDRPGEQPPIRVRDSRDRPTQRVRDPAGHVLERQQRPQLRDQATHAANVQPVALAHQELADISGHEHAKVQSAVPLLELL